MGSEKNDGKDGGGEGRDQPMASPRSMDGDEETSTTQSVNENDNNDERPPAKFSVFQKVIARDKDGLMYDAVIRRCMYGAGGPRQIPLGLFTDEEAEKILKTREEAEKSGPGNNDEAPSWHYFVHYNQWSVNWDRWCHEDDVYEPTDMMKAYAARVYKENMALQTELSSKQKGKKKKQTIDGAAFLRKWRPRLARIDEEMGVHNPFLEFFGIPTKTAASNASSDDKKAESKNDANKRKNNEDALPATETAKKKRGRPSKLEAAATAAAAASAPVKDWGKVRVEEEAKKREHGLTNMRKQEMAKLLIIPDALQKVLVDQWELVCQCNMLSSLPAQITVRQVIDQYLATKAVEVVVDEDEDQHDKSPQKDGGETTKMEDSTEANAEGKPASEYTSSPAAGERQEPATAKTAGSTEIKDDQGDKPSDPVPGDAATKEEENGPTEVDATSIGTKIKKVVPPEWQEMGDGIRAFFDQALPSKLLYQQEVPQLRVLDAILPEDMDKKCFSEIYGPEYLLRLFIGLPEVMADGFAEMAAKRKNDSRNYEAITRTILAKVSDLIRFLHKNQSALFNQAHRPWSSIELKEKHKMVKAQERRKRAQEQAAAEAKEEEATPAASTGANSERNESSKGQKRATEESIVTSPSGSSAKKLKISSG